MGNNLNYRLCEKKQNFFNETFFSSLFYFLTLFPSIFSWNTGTSKEETLYIHSGQTLTKLGKILTLTSEESMNWPGGIESKYFLRSMERNSKMRYNLESCISTSWRLKNETIINLNIFDLSQNKMASIHFIVAIRKSRPQEISSGTIHAILLGERGGTFPSENSSIKLEFEKGASGQQLKIKWRYRC